MVVDKILVVCIGNICRSPMAEGLFRHHFATHGLAIDCNSAGIGALVGYPAAPEAVDLLAARGIDISSHRARQFEPAMASRYDLILVMDREQKGAIEKAHPTVRGRLFRLGHFSDFDIPDPFRMGREAFGEALRGIDRGVQDWLPRLKGASLPQAKQARLVR